MTSARTPRQLGFRFPAEWEPHRGTWFSWPRPEGISFPDKYHTVPENLAHLIAAIVPREEVHINVPNGNWERIVHDELWATGCPLKNVHFHHIATNENWCRDHGPAFLLNDKGQAAIVDWRFNAWGGKYPPYDADDAVPTKIATEYGLRVFDPGIVMEGGAIDVNGAGTLLTTSDCLLNKNRNPKLSRAQIETYLKDYYGQSHVCWLTGGIKGDDTDGHIDDLARFIDPHTVVVGVETNKRDPNYRVLRDVRAQLDELRDQDGERFRIVEIPMPHAVTHEGQRLPATYVNFYFINGALLVPTYRDRVNDKQALAILQASLPDRKVIGIDCVELIWGLGAIHCLTQQEPQHRASVARRGRGARA